jgi:Acyl-CoA carboxylase epsilon subunit
VSRESGTNEVSDGNETNHSARANDEKPHEPHIQILKGHPTDAEVAALVAVLGSAGSAPPPEQPENTRWGLPVDKLRYSISNYQRITLQQRLLMQR